MLLSNRGRAVLASEHPEKENIQIYNENPFHEIENPSGVINLSWAENQLVKNALREKLDDCAIWTPSMRALMNYPEYGGAFKTREVLATFITKYFKSDATIKPTDLTCSTGVTSGHDDVALTIIDPNDVVICPSPTYVNLRNDFSLRAGGIVEFAPFQYENGIDLISAIRDCYERVTQDQKLRVAAIMLINPHNPTGHIFTRQQILPVLHFAKQKNLKVIINETYALTAFGAPFESVLSYLHDTPAPEQIIWLWGVSKSLSLPGLRFGVIHSLHERVTECLARYEFSQGNDVVQSVVRCVLADQDWLDRTFLPLVRSELSAAFSVAQQHLRQLALPFVGGDAGFFVFIDLRKYLTESSFASEQHLDEKLKAAGILLNTGESLGCAEPGWFRMVISVKRTTLVNAFQRLKSVLDEE